MEEPTNYTSTAPQAPTIQEADGVYVSLKYDFQHIFDHDDFEGRVDIVQKFANGRFKRKNKSTSITKTCVCKKVAVNSDFI